MVVEISLFLKDWMLSAYVSYQHAHIFSHPSTQQPLILLEPSMEHWEVYNAKGELLGLLRLQGFEPLQKDEMLFLTIRKITIQRYHFYALQSLSFGRGEDCDVVLQDPYVSVFHCAIKRCQNVWQLMDQNSTNGTYVNGKRTKEHILTAGDVIAIGQFRFIIGIDFFAVQKELPLPKRMLIQRFHPLSVKPKPVKWMSSLSYCEKIQIPLPQARSFQQTSSFFFQLGPGISMALFSLLAMQATSVNVWMQVGILSSMVLWPGLTAIFQHVRVHREKKQIRKQYRQKLDEFEKEKQEMWEKYSSLQQHWKHHLCKCEEWLRSDEKNLYLGEEEKAFFECENLDHKAEDPVCLQMYEKLRQKWETPCFRPVLLRVENLIWIIGERSVCYSLFILMQLLKQCEGRCKLFVFGFDDLSIFGRLRFLHCYQWDFKEMNEEMDRSLFLQKIQDKADDEVWILFCEELSFDPKLLQGEENYCIVVSKKSFRVDRRGIVVDLEQKRYWKRRWYSFQPASYSFAQWETFCVFMEEEPFIERPFANDFLSLFSCGSVEKLSIIQEWNKRKENTLAAYIGWDEKGERVVLDAHEKADGPHGIIAGTTGSGKSELLMTYILSLACLYSPQQVNFFIIDYKGGAMAKTLEDLPHLAGTMTNLEKTSLQRVRSSLLQELTLRQTHFREMMKRCALSTMSIEVYAQHRQQTDPTFAHLFLIVDEFAQLRQEHSEFLEDLQQVARIGRSLGIHLLLCTQKPGGVIDDQIWSNARFHLCLRVQEVSDSQDMLHRKEAIQLRKSGEFLLQVGSDERFVHGFGAYANADYCPSRVYHPNQEHQLRIFDRERKLLFHHTWRTRQSAEKQLPVLCRYLNELAKNRYQVRPICMEDLERYRKRMNTRANLQIGWIDQPQLQRIIPFMIDEGSFAVYTPSLAQATDFLDRCALAVRNVDGFRCYRIGQGRNSISVQDRKVLSILFYHLEKESTNALIFIESLSQWKEIPLFYERLCALAMRHRLILTFQNFDYGLLSRLPQTIRKVSYGVMDEQLLQEWFHAREIPLLAQLDGGVVAMDRLSSFLMCQIMEDNQSDCDSMLSFPSLGWESIGVDENGELFFWNFTGVVIILYGDPLKTKKVQRLVQGWMSKCKALKRREVRIAWAGEEQIKQMIKGDDFEMTICWIGTGIETYGYLYGFRSLSCMQEEMIVRNREEERHIRLWEE